MLSTTVAVAGDGEFDVFVSAMNDRLAALRLFVRVARMGSFSAGGRDLGIPQPTVSRVITALEREIGTSLLTRTTRQVTLTDAGAEFLARLDPILAALDAAEHAVRGHGDLRGTLRVGVCSGFALREVVPRLPLFMDQHPALKLELTIADARQDLVAEGVDVAFRFGDLPNSTASIRTLAEWPRILVASPGYLAAAGIPRHPSELAAHAVVVSPSPAARTWTFDCGTELFSVKVEGRLSVSAIEAATAAAVAGVGIVATSLAGCRHELEAGSLVRLLPAWDMGKIELHAVFAAGKAAKPSAKAFGSFFADQLAFKT